MKQTEAYFSFSEDGFETHTTEEDARQSALAILEIYRDDACDDCGWSEEIERVCYGKIIGRMVEKLILPKAPPCGDSKLLCIECPRGENLCNPLITPPCENYDYSNDGEEYTDYSLEIISGEKII